MLYIVGLGYLLFTIIVLGVLNLVVPGFDGTFEK